MNALFKKKKLTSPKAKKLAKGSHCTLRQPGICKGGKDTTVLAHLNSHRKGWGNKSPDLWAIICCYPCHDWLDFRNPQAIGNQDWKRVLRALMETQEIFIENGILQFK